MGSSPAISTKFGVLIRMTRLLRRSKDEVVIMDNEDVVGSVINQVGCVQVATIDGAFVVVNDVVRAAKLLDEPWPE